MLTHSKLLSRDTVDTTNADVTHLLLDHRCRHTHSVNPSPATVRDAKRRGRYEILRRAGHLGTYACLDSKQESNERFISSTTRRIKSWMDFVQSGVSRELKQATSL